MPGHFGLQSRGAAGQLGQRGFVAFGQFLDALGQRLADAVHLAVDGGVQRGEPFVVDHQGLDLGLGELGVVGVAPARRGRPRLP